MITQTKPDDIPRSKPLAVTGTILLAFPLLGGILTLIAMVKAFGTLKTQGAADPSALAPAIAQALNVTLISFPFGIVGLILVNIALIRNHNREQWFYRNVLVLSVIWCILLFPLGLIPGLILFFTFYSSREKFSR